VNGRLTYHAKSLISPIPQTNSAPAGGWVGIGASDSGRSHFGGRASDPLQVLEEVELNDSIVLYGGIPTIVAVRVG
jgi:hypothetical protein